MVSSKNKKATKYTYAERVLGSFSLIQREHKKHAIHLASLRANIQKIANDRNDKLGPHWKNWVGKAVHRLEEEGILASAEPVGTLVLTPNGKKAISAARRSLALPANDMLSADQEDLLWKQVTHQASGQAVKRVRRHIDSDEDSDNDEPEYVPPKSRKRARTSLHSSKAVDPAFKLTKAQLVEELADLRRAREADLLRAASPLTELEDDESEELMRLKEIIRQKEDEMHDLRRELAGRNFEDPPDVSMSSPIRAPVTRTQSGSLINHLSKQPTPAPTEREPSEYNDHDMFDAPDPVPVVRSPFTNALVTPDATPARNYSKAQLNNTVSSLEHNLHLRASELQNLEHKLSEIRIQLARSQNSLSDKDARISNLQTNLNSYESQISEKDAIIALESSRISDLERAKADLETSIAEKVAQFQRLIREREDTIASLESEKGKHQLEVSRLRQELSDSEQAVAAHVAEITTATIQATSLESNIASLQRDLDAHAASNAVLLEERTRLGAELTEQTDLVGAADEAKQTLLKNVAELDRRIQEKGAAHLALQEELARSVANLAAESERLRDAESRNELLEARLADSTAKLSAAQDDRADALTSAEALKPQIAALDDALTKRISSLRELQERLVKTQREFDTFRLKINILETTVTNVRGELESKKLEAIQLEKNLAERVKEHAALAATLQDYQQQLSEASGVKEELQIRLDGATSQLQLAVDAEGKLRASRDLILDQLAAADAAKTSLIADLATSSAIVAETASKLREAEEREGLLRHEVAAKDQELQQINTQAEEATRRLHDVEQAMAAVSSKYISDIADKESARIALADTLSSVREDVERLTLDLISARKGRDEVQGRLEGEVRRITDALDSERLRGKLLETGRAEAIARVDEVEEELLELQASKEADATTIEGLKDVFSQLKTAQMHSLAELENKLGSANSSPVPKRRASRIARSA
ncbi:hypothetical protein B0H11DRAFT_2202218 [Mycena galericulata]|nr:hypothetical protein B0H11DRAFT_2202218 [Mycena galericulata]